MRIINGVKQKVSRDILSEVTLNSGNLSSRILNKNYEM
jgi:hypothetical protein